MYFRIESLQEVIVENNIKLVILDSVASVLRRDYDFSNIFQRQSMILAGVCKTLLIFFSDLLSKEASTLKYIAETFDIPIVVTNQVRFRFYSVSYLSIVKVTTTYSPNPSYGFQSGLFASELFAFNDV